MNCCNKNWFPLLIVGVFALVGVVWFGMRSKNVDIFASPQSPTEDVSDASTGIPTMPGSAGVDGQTWLVSFEQARQLSAETGRPILVDFTGSDWCGWCIRLHEEVFSKPEFEAWAKSNVILLELDFPQQKPLPAALKTQNERLLRSYGVSGFPTILFLDADGNALGRTGYLEGGAPAWIEAVDPIVGG